MTMNHPTKVSYLSNLLFRAVGENQKRLQEVAKVTAKLNQILGMSKIKKIDPLVTDFLDGIDISGLNSSIIEQLNQIRERLGMEPIEKTMEETPAVPVTVETPAKVADVVEKSAVPVTVDNSTAVATNRDITIYDDELTLNQALEVHGLKLDGGLKQLLGHIANIDGQPFYNNAFQDGTLRVFKLEKLQNGYLRLWYGVNPEKGGTAMGIKLLTGETKVRFQEPWTDSPIKPLQKLEN